MKETDLYRKCLLNGVDLQYKRLSVCNLRNHLHQLVMRGWQVHSEGLQFSHVYENVEDAVEKFMELKKKVR